MKKTLLTVIALVAGLTSVSAVDDNTVEVTYNGSSATISVASNIASYVTVSSGTSSHVKIVQSAAFAGVDATVDNEDGEIIYVLKGTSTDGEFYLDGSFKCTVELNGLTLTNPSGPAINIQNGKRIAVSAQKGTTNTLTDGANETYKGCYHCKGHTKFKGKGTLTVKGNSRHAIYSGEYIEVKNLTLNVTGAVKDGIHCQEYFLMESGTVTINSTGDDGLQVELDGLTSTGTTTGHEDEDSGNFYMTGGTLNITGYTGKAVKADGLISTTGGTRNFSASDMEAYSGIDGVTVDAAETIVSDLSGRRMGHSARPGIYVVRQGGKTVKKVVR